MRRREREKHVTRLLPGYAERKLTPGGQARVERHLEGCKSCRQLLDRLQEARQALAAATPVSAPPTLWRRVEARLPVASPLQSETDDSSRRMKRRLKELSANRPKAEETVNTLAAWKSRLWPVRVLRWGWLGLVLGGVFLMTRFADDGERKKPSPGENTIVQASSAISWNVKRLRGTPRVGNATVADVARLKVGESLITGAKDSARIQIADIGQADVAPNSRLRLITTRNTQHRLALDRGELRAHVLAPPRLFLVDTPSAVAVDLGCAYYLKCGCGGQYAPGGDGRPCRAGGRRAGSGRACRSHLPDTQGGGNRDAVFCQCPRKTENRCAAVRFWGWGRKPR